MPGIFSHPAAVVPLNKLLKHRLVLPALIIGSCTPDFEYLLRLSLFRTHGHSLLGMFYFCLPVGLVTLLIFHYFLEKPIVLLLPDHDRKILLLHCNKFRFFPPKQFLNISISIVIGAFTHIVWDSFTHSYGWAVQRVPALSVEVIKYQDLTFAWYRIFQHGSTLLGFGLLLYWYRNWHKSHDDEGLPPGPRLSVKTRWAIFLLIALLSIIGGALIGDYKTADRTGYVGIRRFFVWSGLWMTLLLFGLMSLYATLIRIIKPEFFRHSKEKN